MRIDYAPVDVPDHAAAIVERQSGKGTASVADRAQYESGVQHRSFVRGLRGQRSASILLETIAHDDKLFDFPASAQLDRRRQLPQDNALVRRSRRSAREPLQRGHLAPDFPVMMLGALTVVAIQRATFDEHVDAIQMRELLELGIVECTLKMTASTEHDYLSNGAAT